MDRHQQFLNIYLAGQHDLRAFIGAVVRNNHLADDIAQEVAVVLWKRFDDYDQTVTLSAAAVDCDEDFATLTVTDDDTVIVDEDDDEDCGCTAGASPFGAVIGLLVAAAIGLRRR